jgi:hypothetical protein
LFIFIASWSYCNQGNHSKRSWFKSFPKFKVYLTARLPPVCLNQSHYIGFSHDVACGCVCENVCTVDFDEHSCLPVEVDVTPVVTDIPRRMVSEPAVSGCGLVECEFSGWYVAARIEVGGADGNAFVGYTECALVVWIDVCLEGEFGFAPIFKVQCVCLVNH